VLHESFPDGYHPLRKDAPSFRPPAGRPGDPYLFHHVHGEGVMEIPVGPIHAGIIEPAHFRFSAVGEVILLLEARLFYTHRGLERQAEGRSADVGLIVAERACGVCAAAHGVAYAQAVEQIAGVTIPPRAAALRTVLLELERLYNHIGDIGNICAGAALMVGAAHGGRIKETLQRLNERLTGNRYLRGLVALGGLRRDLADDELANLRHTLVDVQHDVREYVDTLGSIASFQERLARTGILSREIALAFGAVGVAARASGIARDSRCLYPQAAYAEHRPAVAVRPEGDVLARVRVRIDEVSESFHLVREVLRTLPGGPVRTPLGPLPPSRAGLGIAESPRGDTVHWLLTGPDGTIDRLRIRSASYCNWPVVGFAGPGNMVPDFPLINKSFELCYSCCDR
jgi:Ni,Fe-hydrogenase III large subunit